jgi:hypothetical protein
LEKLKAGVNNFRQIEFCGEMLKMRLLSESELQQCRSEAQAYAKVKQLDEESQFTEMALRQLFLAVTDNDGNKIADSLDSFRQLITRVEREFLIDEYLALEQDSLPSLPSMKDLEFEQILEEVKKSPDSVLNSSNTFTLRRLLSYLENQP